MAMLLLCLNTVRSSIDAAINKEISHLHNSADLIPSGTSPFSFSLRSNAGSAGFYIIACKLCHFQHYVNCRWIIIQHPSASVRRNGSTAARGMACRVQQLPPAQPPLRIIHTFCRRARQMGPVQQPTCTSQK